MEPLLLGLAVPTIAETAGVVKLAVAPVTKLLTTPFASLLQAESQPRSTATSLSASELPTLEFEGLDARAEELQKDLESRIQRVIKDSGLKLNFPVRLGLSESDGTLEAKAVASPEREILEAALARDPSLADDFRQLAAMRKFLSDVKKEDGFAASFRDPRQAIADYASQTDDRFEAVLRLSKSDNRLRLDFEEASVETRYF